MATRVFKTDATYMVRRTFYDEYQRKCGLTTDPLAVVHTPDRTYAFTDYISNISWSVSNAAALTEIPDWAHYFSIDITLCLRTRFFLQLRGRNASYAKKGNDGTYTFTNINYSPGLDGVAIDISTLSAVNMGYSFTPGDIAKIYIGANVYSLAITAQQGSWIVMELNDVGTLTAATPLLFEIYTPYKPSTSEPAYEVGQFFPVNNPGTNTRAYSITSGVIQGDVWLLDRKGINYMTYQVQSGNIIAGFYTVGINFVAQIASNPNILTGNSPLQNLVGFDYTTNNDRWIVKTITGGPYSFNISGTFIYTPDTDTSFALYLQYSDGTVKYLVSPTHLIAGATQTYNVNVDFDMPDNTRVFVIGENDSGTNASFQTSNFVVSVASDAIHYTAEAMSPNDKFYQNWFTDAGRANFTDTIGQQVLNDDIPFSNTFIAGSKQNGLSTYDALDVVSLPQECGPIEKLQMTSKVEEQGAVMLAICRQETASMYLGEVQVVAQAQNAFLSSSPNVIGTINILKGSFGTRNPESVQEFKGNVYWLSADNGKYIQYGINGLFPISNYSMTKFWKLFSENYLSLTADQIEAFGSRPFVFTGIDPHNGELLVSVPQVLANPPKGYLPDYPDTPYPFDIWDGRAKSVVYKLYKEPNYWQGSYDIPAENFVYAGNILFAIKNGTLYQLNSETDEGTFFGTKYPLSLMLVENQNPSKPKVYNNIALEANKIPVWAYFRTEDPYIQASDLKDFDPWDSKEGAFYCYLYKDKLTPAPTGLLPNALLLGDKMRSPVLFILLQWDASVRFRFVNIGYSPSLGHTM